MVFPDDSELAEPVNQTSDHTPPVAPDVQPNPAIRPELDNPVPEIRRSTRIRRAPDRYGQWDYSFGEEGLIVNSNNNIEPRSLFEAINSSESSEWKLAMERELTLLINIKYLNK